MKQAGKTKANHTILQTHLGFISQNPNKPLILHGSHMPISLWLIELRKWKYNKSTKDHNEIIKNICNFSCDLVIRKLLSHTTSLIVLNSPLPSLSSNFQRLPSYPPSHQTTLWSCSTQKMEAAGGTFPLILCRPIPSCQHQPPYLPPSHLGMWLSSPCS